MATLRNYDTVNHKPASSSSNLFLEI